MNWMQVLERGNKLDDSIRYWYFSIKRCQLFGRNFRMVQYRKAYWMVRR